MKFTYPAVVHPCEDGSYLVTFPDLTGCTARGADIDDALDNAIAAELDWIIAELEEEEPELPLISDRSSISLAEGEFIRNIGVIYHMQEGWSD